jgi:hypothetical protein
MTALGQNPFHLSHVETSRIAARTTAGGAAMVVLARMEKEPLGPWVGIGIGGCREDVGLEDSGILGWELVGFGEVVKRETESERFVLCGFEFGLYEVGGVDEWMRRWIVWKRGWMV